MQRLLIVFCCIFIFSCTDKETKLIGEWTYDGDDVPVIVYHIASDHTGVRSFSAQAKLKALEQKNVTPERSHLLNEIVESPPYRFKWSLLKDGRLETLYESGEVKFYNLKDNKLLDESTGRALSRKGGN